MGAGQLLDWGRAAAGSTVRVEKVVVMGRIELPTCGL